jgi:hypothetical protein
VKMGRALLAVGVIATLGLIATAVLGYLLPGSADPAVPRHVLAALVASLLLLFSHCWILLYLIGTGRAIRQAIREFGVEASLAAEAGRLRRGVLPWLLLAAGTALATFFLGAAAITGAASAVAHHILFYVTLVAQAVALWIEGRGLAANERLLGDIDQRLGMSPVPPVPFGARGAA